MINVSFKKEFKAAVLDGSKPHTIRAEGKREYKVGDHLQLFTGLRTKSTEHFADAKYVPKVDKIRIVYNQGKPYTMVNGRLYTPKEVEELAINDGFPSAEEFYEFFKETAEETKGVFNGSLIWLGKVTPPEPKKKTATKKKSAAKKVAKKKEATKTETEDK